MMVTCVITYLGILLIYLLERGISNATAAFDIEDVELTNGKSVSIRSTKGPTGSLYFMSQNAAGYAVAESDCKAFLGKLATLAYIETQERLENVTKELQKSVHSGSEYWIGGSYDADKGQFVWGNGIAFGQWAPWDQGHPKTKLPVTKVTLYFDGTQSKFRTEFSTNSYRYICELKVL